MSVLACPCAALLRKKLRVFSKAAQLQQAKVIVVLGAQWQWGDGGKAKVVDMLVTDFDVVCRCQRGSKQVIL